MSVSKATVSLVSTIFLIVIICNHVSASNNTFAKELTITNNSYGNDLKNHDDYNIFLTISNTSSDSFSKSKQFSPKIYGDNIVWENYNVSESNRDIYVYYINNSTNRRITASGSAESPAVYGDKIVWVDNRKGEHQSDIYMYNLSTFTETQITTSGSVVTSVLDRNSPTIYGDKIVWVDNRKGMNKPDIYMYNLSTFTETQITTSGSGINDLAIYGDRVVWTESIGNWSDYKSNIYIYNTSTRNETKIIHSESAADDLAIYGDRVVWTESIGNWSDYKSNLYMYNTSTRNKTHIMPIGRSVMHSIAIYGDRIIWTGYDETQLYMYNISTRTKIQITSSGLIEYNAIYGDRIVWVYGINNEDLRMYNISTSKEVQIKTSNLSPIVLRKKQDTGDIYIHTHLSPDINSSASLDNISFTVFGPNRKYVGNGSYLAILNAPNGIYTVRYEPVSGYDAPISETKVLNEGDSIKFSCNYLPKKRAGHRLDFGDGYVLIIKQIDSGKKEVLLELELDERKVAEAKVRVNESVAIHKKSYSLDTPIGIRYSGPYGISLWNISHDEGGNYIDISINSAFAVVSILNPSSNIAIDSNPRGARIFFDGIQRGNTLKVIPVSDLNMHSIILDLSGYKTLETQHKFDKVENIKITLNMSKNS